MTATARSCSRQDAWRAPAVALGLAAAAFLAGWVLVAAGAGLADERWTDGRPYTLWDQAHYLSIADDGYTLISCADVPGYPPDEWCGTAGWYPAYPALIRAVSGLGMSPVAAAVVLSNAALFGLLFLLAWALRHRPLPDRLVVLLGASWFPGAIYYRAAFPVSLALLGVVGALVALRAGRWLPAGLAGALAVVSYPEGALVGVAAAPAVVAWFQRDGRGDRGGAAATVVTGERRNESAGHPAPTAGRRHDLVVAAGLVGCLAVAIVAVLAVYEVSVGRWDAWYLVQKKYGHGLHSPWSQLSDRVSPLWSGSGAGERVPAAQTALVSAVIVGLGVVAACRRRSLDRLSAMALLFVGVAWLLPLSLGSGLSLYRAESLLLPAVLLFPLLPRWAAAATVVAFGVLFVPMARLFFDATLQ